MSGRSSTWRSTDGRILKALAAAEHAGTLLVPASRTDMDALRRRCAMGVAIEPYPRLFARTEYWDALCLPAQALHAMRGLQQQHPVWAFCGPSAAVVHGLSVSDSLLGTIHVALPKGAHFAARPGLRLHAIGGRPVVQERGLRVTPVAQTVLDCACTLDFPSALAMADSALRLQATSEAELLQLACEGGRKRRGIVQARRTLSYADGLAGSADESIARALMIELGFEVPLLQAEFELPGGRGVARADFAWMLPDGSLIIGELEGGREHASEGPSAGWPGVDALAAERQRAARMASLRASVVRFTSDDLKDPQRFSELLESSGVPRA